MQIFYDIIFVFPSKIKLTFPSFVERLISAKLIFFLYSKRKVTKVYLEKKR